jgi:hypothetical protein
MSVQIRHGDTCMIKMAKSAKLTEAVVSHFVFEQELNVVVNKTVKINMKWNGRYYEGRQAGMDFESDGPEVYKTSTGLRG